MEYFYCDYNATCPTSEAHLSDLLKINESFSFNPSAQHHYGRKAKNFLNQCRVSVLELLGDFNSESSENLVFCSGATEANNLVIQSIRKSNPQPNACIVLSAGEHPSVTEPALEFFGRQNVRLINFDNKGQIDLADLESKLCENVVGCCFVHVQSEMGQVSDIDAISKLVRSKVDNCHLHFDLVQSFGKFPLNMHLIDFDSCSFSGHKIGALKGIGGVYSRRLEQLQPMQFGGSQEHSFRPGTENTIGIASMALRAREIVEGEFQWMQEACDFMKELRSSFHQDPKVTVFGDDSANIGNTVYFHVQGKTVQELLLQLEMRGVCASSGSACSSGLSKPSTAVFSMGVSEFVAKNLVRLSFGPLTSFKAVKIIQEVILNNKLA